VKNAVQNANVAAVVTNAAVSEIAVADVSVASAKEEAIDQHANQEDCANLENLANLAKVVAADVNAALGTMADGHAMIDAAEVEEVQTMDARGHEIQRTKVKVMEIRRGDVETS
jgi:hypothetical protein